MRKLPKLRFYVRKSDFVCLPSFLPIDFSLFILSRLLRVFLLSYLLSSIFLSFSLTFLSYFLSGVLLVYPSSFLPSYFLSFGLRSRLSCLPFSSFILYLFPFSTTLLISFLSSIHSIFDVILSLLPSIFFY